MIIFAKPLTMYSVLPNADASYNPSFVYPVVYMFVTTTLVTLNVFFGVYSFSLDARIRFGYVVFLISLTAVPIVQYLVFSVGSLL